MGIMDRMLGEHRRTRPVAVITPSGRRRLEQPSVQQSEWLVLNHLSEAGASTTQDIATELDAAPDKIKGICKRLESEGYIKRAGSDDG